MITVKIMPFTYEYVNDEWKLVVRYRAYEDGRWLRNRFVLFLLPVHEEDMFERGYIEFKADQVYWQQNMFIRSFGGFFFSPNSHISLT